MNESITVSRTRRNDESASTLVIEAKSQPHWYSVLCCPDFEEKELNTFIEDILSAIADKLDVLSRDNDLRPLNAFVNNIGMSLEPASTSNPFMSKID